MKSGIYKLFLVAMLAALIPGVVAADSSDLYLKRFSLYGWVGGGGGAQVITISFLGFIDDETINVTVGGATGGVGIAFNHLFLPNLRMGLGLEGMYLYGSGDDGVDYETTYVMPRLMFSYIIDTSVGGIEPELFWGIYGGGEVCQSGDTDNVDSCDAGVGGGFGAGVYWTPPNMRWLSLGANFRVVAGGGIFGNSMEAYLGMVNARFQYNFGN